MAVSKGLEEYKYDSEDLKEKELLLDPKYIVQEPLGGPRCVRHPEKPAVMRLQHSQILGENLPQLNFCEECSMNFKLIPLMKKEPSEMVLRHLSNLANRLDDQGLHKEADLVDELLKQLV